MEASLVLFLINQNADSSDVAALTLSA